MMREVEFQGPVGYLHSARGRFQESSYWFYTPPPIYDDEITMEPLSAKKVEWEKISSSKRWGTGIYNVPIGSLVKNVHSRRGEKPEVTYYLATEQGLQRLEHEPFREVLKAEGPVTLEALGDRVKLPDGKTVKIINGYLVKRPRATDLLETLDAAERLFKNVAETYRNAKPLKEIVVEKNSKIMIPCGLLEKECRDLIYSRGIRAYGIPTSTGLVLYNTKLADDRYVNELVERLGDAYPGGPEALRKKLEKIREENLPRIKAVIDAIIEKTGLSPEDILLLHIDEDWVGFKTRYLNDKETFKRVANAVDRYDSGWFIMSMSWRE